MKREDLKDGMYKSSTGTYYAKGGKIMMCINGDWYKTSTNFMIGTRYIQPLTEEQVKNFDDAYNKCKQW